MLLSILFFRDITVDNSHTLDALLQVKMAHEKAEQVRLQLMLSASPQVPLTLSLAYQIYQGDRQPLRWPQ